MSARRRILVASSNPGKVAELRAMLGVQAEWVDLRELQLDVRIEEDGTSFAENARRKALGYAKASGLWAIADDSGLVVDALDGAPGVHSARFCGEVAEGQGRRQIDQRNIEKVLKLLEKVPAEKRTARFVCHLCLADADGILLEAEGRLEGLITEQPVGENGFGYDPIFFVPELGKTVAQLSAEQKNAISHRGKAIAKLRPMLAELLRKKGGWPQEPGEANE